MPPWFRGALHGLPDGNPQLRTDGGRPLRDPQSGPVADIRVPGGRLRSRRDRAELLAHRKGVAFRTSGNRSKRRCCKSRVLAFLLPRKRRREQVARIYSYSDRCRYYWVDPTVQQELAQLRANLDNCPVPPTLFSQHLPSEYEAIRSGWLPTHAEDIIQKHIRTVLHVYAAACGIKTTGSALPCCTR